MTARIYVVCANESCRAMNEIDVAHRFWICTQCCWNHERTNEEMAYWNKVWPPPAPNPLAEFDAALATITQRRGATYGHPGDDFREAAAMKSTLPLWKDRRFRHIAEMIVIKLARLATTPTHVDSLVDIAGYARTWAMILERDYHGAAVEQQKANAGEAQRRAGLCGGVPPAGDTDGTFGGRGGSPTAPGPSNPSPGSPRRSGPSDNY